MVNEMFVPGQRWLSQNEPELGLGLVIKAERGRVSVLFPASGETRQYTTSAAPLTRVKFSVGDEIHGHDGSRCVAEAVIESGGLLTYRGGGRDLPESALADSLNFTKPMDRLMNAQLDDKGLFNLRSKALHHRFETLRGHQRGFVGTRIDLIPHQLFAALQMRRKGVPRVVLADESGIGKTIEAGLVIHRLLVTSRVDRVLVSVPAEGLSRWHYELGRRMNLDFAIAEEGKVPFPGAPLVLCSHDSLGKGAKLGWDLIVIDYADQCKAKELKKLCTETPAVILLTDEPPAVEPAIHDQLQKLLDPKAKKGLKIATEKGIDPVALAEKLTTTDAWSEEDKKALEILIGAEVDTDALSGDGPDPREKALAALLEAVGAGRRLLRNTRAGIEGLPERDPLPEILEADEATREALRHEFLADGTPNPDFTYPEADPRLAWTIKYLDENPKDKVVLICATRERAEAIAAAVGSRAATHHEGMDLAAKDQVIARFTEKESETAVQLIACSELGVEGRSLPFAHHLFLFDQPPHAIKLQKRISQLDRFGHMAKVRVHIPLVKETPAEIVYKWLSDGLDLYEEPCAVVTSCHRARVEEVCALTLLPHAEALEKITALVEPVRAERDELLAKLEAGRDRLTELASYRVMPAHRILESVRRLDSDLSLDFLMLRLFEHFGFDAEDVNERTYNVKPKEKDRIAGALPEVPPTGQLMTFERQKAMARSEALFCTWDHPLVMNAIDFLITNVPGNSCYAVWEDLRAQLLLLEALFRVELENCPKRLYTMRFFSPAGVRLIVNHELEDVGNEYPMELVNRNVRNGRREWIRTNGPALKQILPRMLESLTERATARAAEMSTTALAEMEALLVPELDRMKLLKKRGGPASDMEIQLMEDEITTLREVLSKPVVRLDSLRLVRRGPAGKGI